MTDAEARAALEQQILDSFSGPNAFSTQGWGDVSSRAKQLVDELDGHPAVVGWYLRAYECVRGYYTAPTPMDFKHWKGVGRALRVEADDRVAQRAVREVEAEEGPPPMEGADDPPPMEGPAWPFPSPTTTRDLALA